MPYGTALLVLRTKPFVLAIRPRKADREFLVGNVVRRNALNSRWHSRWRNMLGLTKVT
jgi:hypothetical protein